MEKITCFAEISIQGERVLQFVNCTQDRAVYDVIGFHDPSITIVDYRRQGLDAIDALLETREMKEFAPKFNVPARVELQSDADGNILIELSEAGGESPAQMLWIAVGFCSAVPVYDTLFESIVALENDDFALVSLFHIPAMSAEVGDQFSIDFSGVS